MEVEAAADDPEGNGSSGRWRLLEMAATFAFDGRGTTAALGVTVTVGDDYDNIDRGGAMRKKLFASFILHYPPQEVPRKHFLSFYWTHSNPLSMARNLKIFLVRIQGMIAG